jgi:long-chain acyl-CoA synthetase
MIATAAYRPRIDVGAGVRRTARGVTIRSAAPPSRRYPHSVPATLLDLLEDAVARYGDRTALSLRRDDGSTTTWSFGELDRRSKIAAWRLHALELQPGDRLLTWSASTPELPAAYFGAMRARSIIVPLDLRMSVDAVEGIVKASEARHLVLGTGRDAPDPREAGLDRFPTTTVEALCAEPDESFPPDWETQLAAWPRPAADELFELVFTSGTTGTPKGVMLAHDNVLASIESFHRIVPPMEHRLVSVLPLSHLLEQAVGLYYALSVGADILYVRSRNPRVIFDALRDHRVTSMVVVPQVLDLFWSAIEREVAKRGQAAAFERLRRLARHLPAPLRRRLFGSVHAQLGGQFRLFLSSGAFLPPALQQGWEDVGVTTLQGYGTTETGTGACGTLDDHGLGTVGRPPAGIQMRIADDGEIQFQGPTLFKGYWRDPSATAAAYTPDGWYRTGDIGHLDAAGRLILSGRSRDMIVLPNGFNVYPEDIENQLRIAGLRDAVVVETRPGRIEAIVLAEASGEGEGGAGAGGADGLRARIDVIVKSANGRLGPNQRIAGWRLWPEQDFPRTHSLKIIRGPIRAWAVADTAAPPGEPA